MTTEAALLAAVAASPDDDLPRLVYADFLEETGDAIHAARSHFIRAQIALETLRPRTREFRRAKAMEERLREMFLHNWLYDLPEYLRDGRVAWRRGFPEQVQLTVAELTTDGEELFRWFPFTRLTLEPARGVTVGGSNFFQNVPTLSRLTHLQFSSWLWQIADDDPDEEPLFASLMQRTGFPALQTLCFAGQPRLSDAWLVRFVSRFPDASFAATLRELDLSNCRDVTDAGANTLATARGLDRLTVLNLTGVPLNPPAIAMLRLRFGDGLRV